MIYKLSFVILVVVVGLVIGGGIPYPSSPQNNNQYLTTPKLYLHNIQLLQSLSLSSNIILSSTNNINNNNNNNEQHYYSLNQLYIVQYNSPIRKHQYQELLEVLKNVGGILHHYIPQYSYLVVIPSDQVDLIARVTGSSIQFLQPQLKVSPTLHSDALRVSSPHGIRVSVAGGLTQVQDIMERLKKSHWWLDRDIQMTIDDGVIEIVGNQDIGTLLNWMSRQPLVYWIERLYVSGPSNKYARYSVQSGSVNIAATPLWSAGINGSGEVFGCADSGIDMQHCYFYDTANGNTPSPTHRKVVSYTAAAGGDTTDQLDGHGTHVVGTVLGAPAAPGTAIDDFVGGAPQARVAFIDIGGTTRGVFSIPSDPSTLLSSTYAANARVHLDAWNSDSGAYYSAVTASLDAFQNTHLDFLAVRSAGNSPLFQHTASYTVTQESASKNSLVVGSYNQDHAQYADSINKWDYDVIYADLQTQVCTLNNPVYGLRCSDVPAGASQTVCCGGNTILAQLCCKATIQSQYSTNSTYTQYTVSVFSGAGPTADGRVKPDLLAPGSPVVSSRSQGASATPDHCSANDIGATPLGSLVAMEGTSQSAAVAAGAALLVRQYLRQGYYINGLAPNATAAIASPSASLVKAVLINTANTASLVNASSALGFTQGHGLIDLAYLIANGSVRVDIANSTDSISNTGHIDQVCYQVEQVSDFVATLVWTDPAGSPLSPLSLVNDLDLVIYQYINNNVTVFNQNDHINNVETITIKNAPVGRYDVRVFGVNVPIADQTFSVVTNGNIKRIQCSQCYYDPANDQKQECQVKNGIGIQSCGSDNQWTKCEIYSCNSGYVLDKGITKSCVTMLALTLYNIALLAAFGLIILVGVVSVLLFYKSRSLSDAKYKNLKSSSDGNNNNNNDNSQGGGGGGDSKGKSVELTVVGAGIPYSSSGNGSGSGGGSSSGAGGNGDGNGGAGAGAVLSSDDNEEEETQVQFSLIEIISLAKQESWFIVGGIILSFVDIALGLAIPLVSANIFDLLYSGSTSNINGVILTFALIIIGMIIVQFFYGILLALAGHKIIARLRKEMFRRILMQDMDFFNERKTGELMSRLASDVSSVRSIISDSIPQMITQIATILGGMIMLFIISWKLTLVVLCPLPVLLVASKFYGEYIEKISMMVQDALADAATHAAETLFNIRTVRWFSAEEREASKFAALIDRSYRIALRMTIWNGIYNSTSGIFEQLSIFILLWYGATLVRSGELTPSMLIAFNLFLPFISGSLTHIATLYTTYKSYKGCSYRFFEIMQRVPRIPPTGGVTRDRVQGNLSFRDVSFSYSGQRDTQVLGNINLNFQPGTITALIGPSGGGKSSLLSLIGRLYNIQGGCISLDGTDISTWDIANLHEHISIVNQEPSLFSGTIAENVAYGKPNATRQQVMDACRQANAHDFITAMPNGYETIIGERGASLSGGQKQRIAIARTILKNPTVLLLDEATSELDMESERLVQEAIDNLVQNRTVIIVAHRLSTILTADIIVVINDGGVTEMGTPEQLVEQKGMFYDFVQIQYGKQGDVPLHIPTKSRNKDKQEKLRLRSETIQRVGLDASRQPPRPIQPNLMGNDQPSSLNVSQIKRPPSQPMWRQGKKYTPKWNDNKSSLLIRQEDTNVPSQWHRGAVDDKLNRLVAKTRKKGFFKEENGHDIKQSLINY